MEGAVLLHGIARTHRSMAGIARVLERAGYTVLNLHYPSRRKDIAALAEHIAPQVQAFAKQVTRVHFVGHSMGGLVIRTYLAAHRPPNLGKVVMLGTPNQGSEVADAWRNWPVYRWVFGPAGQQLITDQAAFASMFGTVDYPLCVIAGDYVLEPIGGWIIGKPSDDKVSVESTKIAGMKQHVVLPVSHALLPINRRVRETMLAFLCGD